VNEQLEAWIQECVGKGTFASRADAIEFCVGATRAFCEVEHLNQEKIKEEQKRALEQPELEMEEMPLSFPLKWSAEIDKWLRKKGTPPPPTPNARKLLGEAGLAQTQPIPPDHE